MGAMTKRPPPATELERCQLHVIEAARRLAHADEDSEDYHIKLDELFRAVELMEQAEASSKE